MKKIIQLRWGILVGWIALTVAAVLLMPNMANLILEKGQPKIPDSYSTVTAGNLTKEFDGKQDGQVLQPLLVFTSSKALTAGEMDSIQAGIEQLDKNKKELGITTINTHFTNDDLKDQLVSKDGTSVLVSISMNKNDREVDAIQEALTKQLSSVSVTHYITGELFINDASLKTNLDGVKKTEIFTITFIFLILLVVFRSPLTPIISLFTIGLTYVVSLSVVTQLVDKFNFPFASTTQTFLILVLFGIGTDYNILLLMRFKEELQKHPINEAIVRTYKTAGKTVIYSAMTVLVGFSVLYFANFSIFRASSAVAIAIVVFLVQVVTLLPFFMKVLGHRIFWPLKKTSGHKENAFWRILSTFSVSKPILALLAVLIITVPFVASYKNVLSYDMLKEVDPSYDAIKAIDVVSDHFDKGKATPTTIYVKSDKELKTNESLGAIDKLTEKLANVPGVQSVASITRPKGDVIKELYVSDQTKSVTDGLNKATDGLNTISKGLGTAGSSLPATLDLSKVDQLISGTASIQNGLGQLTSAMGQLQSGIQAGAGGASQLNDGIKKIESSLQQLSSSTAQLQQGYNGLQNGFSQLSLQYTKIAAGLAGLNSVVETINKTTIQLGKDHPELVNDQNYQILVGNAAALAKQFPVLQGGLTQVNDGFGKAMNSFTQLNTGLGQVTNGQQQITAGVSALGQGAQGLADGLAKGSAGQSQVTENMGKLTTALGQVNSGQGQLKDGLNTLGSQLPQLKDGLTKSTDGLNSISSGVSEANKYLGGLSKTKATGTFYIPEDKLTGPDFQKAFDAYESKDYKITKLVVTLEMDPYSSEAITVMNDLHKAMDEGTGDSAFGKVTYGIGGVSSSNHDLKDVSTNDFARTQLLMIIGIAVVLFFITRSVFEPIYIIIALIIAYYAALSGTQFIYGTLLGQGDLAWTVPFFSFIMVMALGVDYSIFLLMRFNEYGTLNPREGIVKAAMNIGGVIISAAFILCGTFAAMYPSFVPTLTQLATVVIIGLLLLSFVLLPLFVPAVISLNEKRKELEKKGKVEPISFDV